MGKDSLDKLLFASDKNINELGKEIAKNLKSLGVASMMALYEEVCEFKLLSDELIPRISV
ncbi:hypothetical protein HanLR1_Chr05g0171191 [Helianthus annuus]|nr:hypothetical protein HanLR1_Chr05g0171191 [Helianthus annuus]